MFDPNTAATLRKNTKQFNGQVLNKTGLTEHELQKDIRKFYVLTRELSTKSQRAVVDVALRLQGES